MTIDTEGEDFVKATVVESEWELGYKAAQEQSAKTCAAAFEQAKQQEERIATLVRQVVDLEKQLAASPSPPAPGVTEEMVEVGAKALSVLHLGDNTRWRSYLDDSRLCLTAALSTRSVSG